MNRIILTLSLALLSHATLPAQGASKLQLLRQSGSAQKSQTRKVPPRISLKAALTQYRQRASALTPDDTAKRYELATWCFEQKLRSTGRRELVKVIKADPEHVGARILLGHKMINGRWLTANQAHKALGHVRYKGSRYEPQNAARLAAFDKERKRIKNLQREVNRLVRRLASSSEKRRVKARDGLLTIARKENLPHVARAARIGYVRYKKWWAAYRSAIVEIRATQATLVGLRPRQLSLGTGAPVTIELPELKKVSIGTTVGVPLGR